MASSAVSWPVAVFPKAAVFHPDQPSRSGGASLSGVEQITTSPAGRWRARVEVPITNENAVLAWRALLAQIQGRAGTVLVAKWENYGPKDINGRRLDEVATAAYDDDSLNFDLSGFAQSDLTHATLAASAALGATQISVNVVDGEGPRPGQYFGIGDRLYLVSAAWHEGDGEPLQLQFWPRLRSAVQSGERIILDKPVCLMRLADDNSGELMLDYGYWGTATLDFTEVL